MNAPEQAELADAPAQGALLEVTWNRAGGTQRVAVTQAIVTTEIRVVLMLEQTPLNSSGEPAGRTTMRLLGGDLTSHGPDIAGAGGGELPGLIKPLLTFERTLDLLARTDPETLRCSPEETRVCELAVALRHVPAGAPRDLGLTLLRNHFPGTTDELVAAVTTATRHD